MTKNISCWLLLMIVFFTVFTPLQVQASEVLEVSIAEAVEYALSHNLDLKLAALELEQAQAGMRRAEIVGDEEMLKEAAEKLDAATEAYESLRQELSTKVQNIYLEVLHNSLALERQAAAKTRAEEQLRVDGSKYAAGLLSSLDIMRAEISLANAENNYAAAQDALATNKLRLSELLGLPLHIEVILTERPALDYVPFDYTLEECFNMALEIDQGIRRAREALEKAHEAVKAAQNPFVAKVQLEDAQAAEKRAEIELEKAETALYFRIRNDYLTLMRAAQNVKVKAREVELEQRILEAEEIKYSAGVVSNAQIVAQQEKLAAVEQEYSKALLDYNLGRSNLLQQIGQPVVWSEGHETEG